MNSPKVDDRCCATPTKRKETLDIPAYFSQFPLDRTVFEKCDAFFSTLDHWKWLVCIIKHKPIGKPKKVVSLRAMEYFVSKYACDECICWTCPKLGLVDIYSLYDACVHQHGKRLFDPVRRYATFHYTKFGQSVVTTISQLAFLKWVHEMNVIEHMMPHWDALQARMRKVSSQNRVRFSKVPSSNASSPSQSPMKRHRSSPLSNPLESPLKKQRPISVSTQPVTLSWN